MTTLYISTRPCRAEQYQPGMESILGRRIFIQQGQASYAPHTIRCEIEPGDWVVEANDRLIKLSDEEFRNHYRIFHPGEVRWRSFSEATEETT